MTDEWICVALFLSDCCYCSGTEKAKVLFEYVPENPDELRLEVGDTILEVVQAEEGWMEGTLNGKRGVFPDNFVEVLKEEIPTTSTDGGRICVNEIYSL